MDRLALEHERSRTSGEPLRGLLAVLEGDDHGGPRQALGPYGRILAEALQSHRADELAAAPPTVSRSTSRVSPAGRASDN